MEIDMELYSHENKENGLRRKVSGNTLNTNRACLTDITHKFVPNKTSQKIQKNVGLLALANAYRNNGPIVRSNLPR